MCVKTQPGGFERYIATPVFFSSSLAWPLILVVFWTVFIAESEQDPARCCCSCCFICISTAVVVSLCGHASVALPITSFVP